MIEEQRKKSLKELYLEAFGQKNAKRYHDSDDEAYCNCSYDEWDDDDADCCY